VSVAIQFPYSLRPRWRRWPKHWYVIRAGVLVGLGLGVGFQFLKLIEPGKFVERESARSYMRPANIYDVNGISPDRSWFNQTIRLTSRAVLLFSLYLPLLFIIIAAYLAEWVGFKNYTSYAWSYAMWATARAGPIWIKFAQWVGTRPDIFPVNLCEQCSKFHSSAPAHSWRETEDMLSKSWSNWKSFLVFEDKTPLGTGCITQVYKAVLKMGPKSHTVAVKVMHPKVREQMQLDLNLFWTVLKFCARLPMLKDYLYWSDIKSSLQEFEIMMVSQMDLRNEADNLMRFNENFKNNPQIEFPKPYVGYVTRDVLIESFEEGVFISEYYEAPTDAKMRLADIGLSGFLNMLFIDCFFHDDLHPGNILVREENDDFKLIFLDCGIARSFNGKYLSNFLDLFGAIVSRDGELAGRLIYERSPCNSQCENPELFCKEVRELVDKVDVVHLKMSSVGDILGRMAQICVKHKVQLEGNYASVVVAVLVLEGVGRHLNPDLEILRVLTAHLVKNSCKSMTQKIKSAITRLVD
jgi:aarF domain-containing kinase